ncbi:MbnP family protein [Hymenobacter terricola]|uniref:MbnP family protein n=1 Tax=Hymenobacter terricola TaxID=2819236 RepID=UPI001B302D00|nr:MbnP family protein [Hymenobacter terricola]
MSLFRFTPLLVALPLTTVLFTGCGKKTVEPDAPTTSSFAIELEPVVGATDLELNTQTYTKADGQAFTVSKFKFLFTNLKLTKADGTVYAVPDSYYLFDAATPASTHLVIEKVPVGDYTGLSFVVGVDDAHNNATFTSGGLNHSNDLYWDWSSEYVCLKMAGTSPQAGTGRALTFDIGGAGVARTVAPAFGPNVLPVKDGHVPEIHMSIDLLSLFESTTPTKNINFATTYSVESGSAWAPVIADNYAARMFTVEHVHAN